VSPLWGEKPIFGPLSKNNTGMAALRTGLLVNMLKYKARLKQMNSVYFLEAQSLTGPHGSIQIHHKANHKSSGPIFHVLPKMPPPSAAKCCQGKSPPRPDASDQQKFEARVS